MTPDLDLSEPADTATERPPPGPIGTWTIDHTHSSVALTWRKPRLGTVIGRLHCLGIVHVAVLPPVGVVRFDRPSALPVLTMATLTARGTTALVEPRFEVEASDPDWLVLRGRGVLDRQTLGLGNPPALRNPRVRLDLELHARRVTRTSTEWQNRERPAAHHQTLRVGE